MALFEQDREDLMREAVALPQRVELQVQGMETLVTVGFRTSSAMSVFIGQDPVYQFDPQGRLRRAFVDGVLFRSQHATLAMLKRERTETQTLLLRTDLTEDGLHEFRTTMLQKLGSLERTLKVGDYSVIRCVPEAESHVPQIQTALEMIRLADPWLSPAIRRRM
ncbi:MAG TPA: hypothetical protein PK992_03445 [Planctomycetaceae bacterium]|nr:hypothetical protein [Planctomycetaceae bacterium]